MCPKVTVIITTVQKTVSDIKSMELYRKQLHLYIYIESILTLSCDQQRQEIDNHWWSGGKINIFLFKLLLPHMTVSDRVTEIQGISNAEHLYSGDPIQAFVITFNVIVTLLMSGHLIPKGVICNDYHKLYVKETKSRKKGKKM